jgi:hypothetical protein
MKKIKKLNKHGFLLGEETVKIIIAVLCLVALVYFLVSLYLADQNHDLELAKASIQKLVTDINAGRTETEIYNPQKWVISSWSYNCNNDKEKSLPEYCLNKGWQSCLCICPYPLGSAKYPAITTCHKNGACLENDFTITEKTALTMGVKCGGENLITIQNPPLSLSINQQDKTIKMKEKIGE